MHTNEEVCPQTHKYLVYTKNDSCLTCEYIFFVYLEQLEAHYIPTIHMERIRDHRNKNYAP